MKAGPLRSRGVWDVGDERLGASRVEQWRFCSSPSVVCAGKEPARFAMRPNRSAGILHWSRSHASSLALGQSERVEIFAVWN